MLYKVSVIIPVYNAEPYLVACIDSLLNQTLKECEFIFVNDGSEDQGHQIIEEYITKDPRIRLINQHNQGVSMARNAGLAMASGEYVGFMDADDLIKKDMFGTLYEVAIQHECDVVASNFESEMGEHKVISSYPFETNSILDYTYINDHIIPYFVKFDDFNTVCTKLYKRRTIAEHGITFPNRVALGEDGMFNMNFFCFAQRAKYIDYVGYYYKETVGSATRNIGQKDYFERAVEVYQSELPDIFACRLDKSSISKLKSIRFINTVLSIIHIYLQPNSEVAFSRRYSYIRNVIGSPYITESLPLYYEKEFSSLGRYQKLMIEMMRRKMTSGLYLATVYSRVRNKQWRRNKK